MTRRRPLLWEEVVDALIEDIVSGTLPTDAVLPKEADLCEQYSVSRSVVRDALKVVQEKGLLITKAGIGSVVLPSSDWSAIDPAVISARLRHPAERDKVFDELTRVRIALESEMARDATTSITAEGLTELKQRVDDMADLVDSPADYLEADIEFHAYIMRVSGLEMGSAIMAMMGEPLHEQRLISNQIPGGVRHAQQDHEEIYRLIAARDTEGAALAMRNHLQWAAEQLRQRFA